MVLGPQARAELTPAQQELIKPSRSATRMASATGKSAATKKASSGKMGMGFFKEDLIDSLDRILHKLRSRV